MFKNITFSAEDELIRKARQKALKEKKKLNAVFRDWLFHYVGQEKPKVDLDLMLKRLGHIRAGRKFSREEMNER